MPMQIRVETRDHMNAAYTTVDVTTDNQELIDAAFTLTRQVTDAAELIAKPGPASE